MSEAWQGLAVEQLWRFSGGVRLEGSPQEPWEPGKPWARLVGVGEPLRYDFMEAAQEAEQAGEPLFVQFANLRTVEQVVAFASQYGLLGSTTFSYGEEWVHPGKGGVQIRSFGTFAGVYVPEEGRWEATRSSICGLEEKRPISDAEARQEAEHRLRSEPLEVWFGAIAGMRNALDWLASDTANALRRYTEEALTSEDMELAPSTRRGILEVQLASRLAGVMPYPRWNPNRARWEVFWRVPTLVAGLWLALVMKLTNSNLLFGRCPECGRFFTTTKPWARFCSDPLTNCRFKAHNRWTYYRRRLHQLVGPQEWEDAEAVVQAAAKLVGDDHPVDGELRAHVNAALRRLGAKELPEGATYDELAARLRAVLAGNPIPCPVPSRGPVKTPSKTQPGRPRTSGV